MSKQAWLLTHFVLLALVPVLAGCPWPVPIKVEVPDVVGMSLAEATMALEEGDLEVGNVIQEPTTAAPPGTVIDQLPGAGTRVWEETPVDLWVAAAIQQQVAVPDLAGRTETEAQQDLEAVGLVLGPVTDQVDANAVAGTVISQNPPADTMVNIGTSVSIVIALAPQTVDVPDLTGLTEEEAEEELEIVGLRLGQVTQREDVVAEPDTVIDQNPPPNTPVNLGTSVNIVLAVAPQLIRVLEPNGGEIWAPGETNIIRFELSTAGGENVRIELVDGAGGRTTVTNSVSANVGTNLYNYPVPVNQEERTDYRVEVSLVSDTDVSDQSDSTFTIRGVQKWAATFGGERRDVGRAVLSTNDGGFIAAGQTSLPGSSAGFLVRLDDQGNQQWAESYGHLDTSEAFHAIAPVSDGGYIMAGWRFTFLNTFYDFWVVKVDASGNEQWSEFYNTETNDVAGDEIAHAVLQTTDGGYVIAGSIDLGRTGDLDMGLIKIDADGNQEWVQTYGGDGVDIAYDVLRRPGGGFLLVGTTTSFDADGEAIMLVRTQANGNQVGDPKIIDETGDDGARAIVEDPQGGYYLTGYGVEGGHGGRDLLVMKVNSQLNPVWSELYGTAQDDWGEDIQIGPGGGCIVAAGSREVTYDLTQDISASNVFLIGVDTTGAERWSKSFGNSGVDEGFGLAAAPAGGYVVVGQSDSFGDAEEMYVVKTSPLGDAPSAP